MDNQDLNPGEDLHQLLQEETETKAPTTVNSKMWDFNNVQDAEEITDPKQNPKKTDVTTTGDDPENPPSKITEKAKRASARTAVGMLDLIQKSVFTPIISYKYKKKFTDQEIERLETENLIDEEKSHLQDHDLVLRNKWDRLMKKCSKKIDAVELGETEKKDLEEAFFTYFDYKEKTMPPEWFVGAAVINAFGKRLVDVITD